MINVIEVPVFATDTNLFKPLLGEDKNTRETKYHDFLFLEFELDTAHAVYFYCMDYIPQLGNISLADKIIPKAPFVFFLNGNEAGTETETAENMFLEYSENYTTPAFIIHTMPLAEEGSETEEKLLPDFRGFEFINADPEKPDFIKHILIEAIKRVTPTNL